MIRTTRELAFAVAGFAVGVVVMKLKSHHMTDDDRPTIRVRSGSIQVDIDHGTFTQTGGTDRWMVVGGTESVQTLTVRIPGQSALQTAKVGITFKASGSPPAEKTVTCELIGGEAYVTLASGRAGTGTKSHKRLQDSSLPWEMKSVKLDGHPQTFPIPSPCSPGAVVEIEQTP